MQKYRKNIATFLIIQFSYVFSSFIQINFPENQLQELTCAPAYRLFLAYKHFRNQGFFEI